MIVKTRTFRTKRRSCEHSVRKLTWARGTVVWSEERPCIYDISRPAGDERPVQQGVQEKSRNGTVVPFLAPRADPMISQFPVMNGQCFSPCNKIPEPHGRAIWRTVVRDRRPVNSANVMNINSNNAKSERSCDRCTTVRHRKYIKTEQKHSVRNSGILESFTSDFQAPEALALARIQAILSGLARLLYGFSFLCLFMVWFLKSFHVFVKIQAFRLNIMY